VSFSLGLGALWFACRLAELSRQFVFCSLGLEAQSFACGLAELSQQSVFSDGFAVAQLPFVFLCNGNIPAEREAMQELDCTHNDMDILYSFFVPALLSISAAPKKMGGKSNPCCCCD
jgi:hypothetical protein